MKKEDYNYNRFSMTAYRDTTLPGPTVGERFGDFVAYDLEGNPIHFSDLLTQPVVIETGSVTCPIYAHNVSEMERLAEEYPNIRFVVLYVREAHPGNSITPHATLDEKLEQAKRLDSEFTSRRTIFVDDVAGTVHQRYGDLPNTVYFVSPDGTVLYRSNWNQPTCLEQALQVYPEVLPTLNDDLASPQPSPFFTIRILSRGGWAAIKHFFMEMPNMMKQGKSQHQRTQLC